MSIYLRNRLLQNPEVSGSFLLGYNKPKEQSIASTANGLCFETIAFLQYFLLNVWVSWFSQKIS